MDKSRRKEMLIQFLSVGSLFVFFGALFFLYNQSDYLPFLLSGIFILLLGVLNSILLLFRRDIPVRAEAVPASASTEPSQRGIRRFWTRLCNCLRKMPAALSKLYNKVRKFLRLFFLLATLVGFVVWFNAALSFGVNRHALTYWHLVVLVAVFVLAIVIDKYMKYVESDDSFTAMILRNSRAFLTLTKILSATAAVAVSICMLGLYDPQKIVQYFYVALFYYVVLMIVLSLAVRTIRKELSTSPGIVILLPFFNADIQDLAVIPFLEEHTGITVRSLWSVKFVRKMLPIAFLTALALFWLSTGVVYVDSYQQAAVYRFGELQTKTLEPGLHLRLPFPFEKQEVYNTEQIRQVTIGYQSEDNIDNIWTAAHGDSEYKLLLGSGNEVVSINLRIEYKIHDLLMYVSHATDPEKILESKAYEIATERTISQDLMTLLTLDREAFTEAFKKDLDQAAVDAHTGLEVVSVIMESIHPPVEVASVYQELIGAELEAERVVTAAESHAAVKKYNADSSANVLLDIARITEAEQMAKARKEVAEFMAAVEAYEQYPESYVYYKYLNALCSTYARTKIVFVGEDVDSSRIKIIYGTLE